MFTDFPLVVVGNEEGAITKIDVGFCECGHMYAITEDHDARERFMDLFGPENSVFVYGPNWARCPECRRRILLPSPALRKWPGRPRARMEMIAERATTAGGGFVSCTLITKPLVMSVTLSDLDGRAVSLTMPHDRLEELTDEAIIQALMDAWKEGANESEHTT